MKKGKLQKSSTLIMSQPTQRVSALQYIEDGHFSAAFNLISSQSGQFAIVEEIRKNFDQQTVDVQSASGFDFDAIIGVQAQSAILRNKIKQAKEKLKCTVDQQRVSAQIEISNLQESYVTQHKLQNIQAMQSVIGQLQDAVKNFKRISKNFQIHFDLVEACCNKISETETGVYYEDFQLAELHNHVLTMNSFQTLSDELISLESQCSQIYQNQNILIAQNILQEIQKLKQKIAEDIIQKSLNIWLFYIKKNCISFGKLLFQKVQQFIYSHQIQDMMKFSVPKVLEADFEYSIRRPDLIIALSNESLNSFDPSQQDGNQQQTALFFELLYYGKQFKAVGKIMEHFQSQILNQFSYALSIDNIVNHKFQNLYQLVGLIAISKYIITDQMYLSQLYQSLSKNIVELLYALKGSKKFTGLYLRQDSTPAGPIEQKQMLERLRVSHRYLQTLILLIESQFENICSTANLRFIFRQSLLQTFVQQLVCHVIKHYIQPTFAEFKELLASKFFQIFKNQDFSTSRGREKYLEQINICGADFSLTIIQHIIKYLNMIITWYKPCQVIEDDQMLEIIINMQMLQSFFSEDIQCRAEDITNYVNQLFLEGIKLEFTQISFDIQNMHQLLLFCQTYSYVTVGLDKLQQYCCNTYNIKQSNQFSTFIEMVHSSLGSCFTQSFQTLFPISLTNFLENKDLLLSIQQTQQKGIPNLTGKINDVIEFVSYIIQLFSFLSNELKIITFNKNVKILLIKLYLKTYISKITSISNKNFDQIKEDFDALVSINNIFDKYELSVDNVFYLSQILRPEVSKAYSMCKYKQNQLQQIISNSPIQKFKNTFKLNLDTALEQPPINSPASQYSAVERNMLIQQLSRLHNIYDMIGNEINKINQQSVITIVDQRLQLDYKIIGDTQLFLDVVQQLFNGMTHPQLQEVLQNAEFSQIFQNLQPQGMQAKAIFNKFKESHRKK